MSILLYTGDGTPVKAFLLYVGDEYYPCAANGDLHASGDDVQELVDLGKVEMVKNGRSAAYRWWCVLDHSTMMEVANG